MQKHQAIIKKICQLKMEAGLTPQQNRYVDKQVRKALKLQVNMQEKPLPVYLTPPEIVHFLKNAWQIGPGNGLLCEILIFCGLRIGEATRLNRWDIHSNNQLKVIKGKGNKDRMVPVPDWLIQKVDLYMAKREGRVFAKKNQKSYTTRTLQLWVDEVIDKAAIFKGENQKLHVHSLRHTFACLCLARGMRLEDIQVMMGHESIKTTQVYARLELGQIKEKYLLMMGVSGWSANETLLKVGYHG